MTRKAAGKPAGTPAKPPSLRRHWWVLWVMIAVGRVIANMH